MKFTTEFCAALFAVLLLGQAPARAQAQTPQQIQGLIANGQEGAALSALNQVLAAHPDSGVAWYLAAEANDAAGNEAAARSALAKAQQYAPGLPFADPSKAAALQAHLAQTAPSPAAPHSGMGVSPMLIGLVVLAVLFFALRMFMRARRQYRVQPGYGPGGPGYGGSPGGGGLGSSLLTGLAAGAGFAAGERIIDDITGNNNGGFIDPAAGQTLPPDRDDGLSGSAGWDDNSSQDNGGNFDSGSDW